jgi:hypothetical protein
VNIDIIVGFGGVIVVGAILMLMAWTIDGVDRRAARTAAKDEGRDQLAARSVKQ